MNSARLDLIDCHAIDIGGSYLKHIRLCNSIILTGGTGICQIRMQPGSPIIVSPLVTIISPTMYSLSLNPSDFTPDTVAGEYQYDVLMQVEQGSFYVTHGRVTLNARCTSLVSDE